MSINNKNFLSIYLLHFKHIPNVAKSWIVTAIFMLLGFAHGQTVIFDADFETATGDNAWVADPLSVDATTDGAWERGNSVPYGYYWNATPVQLAPQAGTGAYVTGLAAGETHAVSGGAYTSPGTTTAWSPAFTVPATGLYKVDFDYYFGVGWHQVGQYFKVSLVDATTGTPLQTLLDRKATGITTAQWTQKTAFVSQALAGQSVRVYLEARETYPYTDGVATEAGIDNFVITEDSSHIAGSVFRDWNFNGVMDGSDSLFQAPGMIVNAYDATNTLVASAPVDSGSYAINTTGLNLPLRLELTGIPAPFLEGGSGADGGGHTLFVDAVTGSASFTVADKTDYFSTNTRLLTTCFVNGEATSADGALISINYDGTEPNYDATIAEVGSVWGIAVAADNNKAFTSAFLKRHSGLGPAGLGGIYVVDTPGSPAASASTLIDLDTIYDFGTLPANRLSGVGLTDPSYDLEAFDLVGKAGIGDIEYVPSEQALYAVNLHSKRVVRIDLSGY